MANSVVWFDIPATDLDRAEKFYNAVLNVKCERMQGHDVLVLPHGDGTYSVDFAMQPPSTFRRPQAS